MVIFAKCALEDRGDKLEGKRCIVTGSGWVWEDWVRWAWLGLPQGAAAAAGDSCWCCCYCVPPLHLIYVCVCSNVAGYCAMKLLEEGAVVLAMSDSRGYVYEKGGITPKQLEQVSQGDPRQAACRKEDRAAVRNMHGPARLPDWRT